MTTQPPTSFPVSPTGRGIDLLVAVGEQIKAANAELEGKLNAKMGQSVTEMQAKFQEQDAAIRAIQTAGQELVEQGDGLGSSVRAT